MGQRGKFFFAFQCVSEHFESIDTHFFFKAFVKRVRAKHARCKRKARGSKATENVSAKSEEARRPRSPAGLARAPCSGPVGLYLKKGDVKFGFRGVVGVGLPVTNPSSHPA